ncbi:MAG TPA: tetratricopeptide repeat protein, partial [Sphingobacteriaceae bacterium]
MKNFSLFLLSAILCTLISAPIQAQNKKLDKSLKKIDGLYNGGAFEKALSSLNKFKKSAEKLGPNNNYLLSAHLREARINLALGVLATFETSVTNALNTSLAAYGENSTSFAITNLDVAEIYLDYGNFRLSREYTEKAESILKKTNQLDEALKGRIALTKAEAMIGQGFANAAIDLLKQHEKYYFDRAVEKETIVENNEIKTRRVPETEIFQRFNDYARLKTLVLSAYAKKGLVSIVGADEDNPDVDVAYRELDGWLKGKRRFLGETSLAEVEYKYVFAKALVDNGNLVLPSFVEFDNILSDLKRRTNPTNALAHELYLHQLEYLLKSNSNARYLNTKLEYEKVIDKYYPKESLHRVNLKAVEFDSKLSRDRTKDLENTALNTLSSKSVPKAYPTSIRIYKFLYEVAIAERRYANAETHLNTLLEIQKELCGESSVEYHLTKVKLANFYIDYTNKIEEAGKIYEASYFKFVTKEIAANHQDRITALNHIAQWYEFTDKYALAAKTLIEAKDAANLKFLNTDILMGIELNQIAKLQIKLGEYEEAEKNIKASIQILDSKESRDYVEWRPSFISALETQATLYGIKGMFDEAEENLDQTRRLIEKSDHPIGDELTTAKELSSLYIMLGRYSITDKLLNALIEENEKLFGQNSIRLIEPLVNKGRILLAKGDYTEAEKTATRANQIAVSTYGDASTKSAPTQKLLADIFYTLGDYDKAETNVTKAIASQEKQFGRNHIEVAKSISQLALIKF